MNKSNELKGKIFELINSEIYLENSALLEIQKKIFSISINLFNYKIIYKLIKILWNRNFPELVLKLALKLEKFFNHEESSSFSNLKLELSLYKASALACLTQMDLSKEIFSKIAENQEIDNNLRGICFSNNAMISLIEGNFDKSQELLQKSVKFFKSSQNSKMYVIVSNLLGMLYSTIGKMDAAAILYKEGLEIKTKNKFDVLLAPTYNNLGEIYYNWGDFDQAAQYYELGLKFSEMYSKDKRLVEKELESCPWFLIKWGSAPISLISALQNDSSFFLLNLALVYRSMGENEKSFNFFKLSLKAEEEFQKDQNQARILFEIIYLLSEFPKLGKILIYIKKFEKIFRDRGTSSPLIHQFYLLARGVIYRKEANIRSIAKALDIFENLVHETLQNIDLIKYSYIFLMELYVKELELFDNFETLKKAIELSQKLESMSKDLSNPNFIIQVLIVQSKLAQIQSNFRLAKEKAKEALNIAVEKDMYRLAANVYKELQNLSKNQKIWNDLGNKTSMLKRIKLIKIDSLISAFSKNQSEDLVSIPNFALKNIRFAFFEVTDMGPDLIFNEEISFMKNESFILRKIAMYYSVLLGQGNSSNSGLYGPLPIPELPNYESIVYIFHLPNKNATDPRLKNSTFGIISFFMPEPFIKFFVDREGILMKISSEIQKLKDISEINKVLLSKIKANLVLI